MVLLSFACPPRVPRIVVKGVTVITRKDCVNSCVILNGEVLKVEFGGRLTKMKSVLFSNPNTNVTPWSSGLERPLCSQPVKKCPEFY
jgi:hypothetical protein